MAKVITFGEIMLRLSPPGYRRLVQAESFEATYGGGEANVAVSLAAFGLESAYVTIVPPNSLGEAAVNHLRRFGVNTRLIRRGGERLGIYFAEPGASHRPMQVIYDRKNSAIAEVSPGTFDWPGIFRGADWFHCTGITPALSPAAARETLEACRAAQAAGVKVSCDLNYRERLWTTEEAGRVMSGILPHVNVLMGNLPAVEGVLGIHPRGRAATDNANVATSRMPGDEVCQDVAIQLQERFGLTHVALTRRETLSASENRWSAVLYDGQRFYKSQHYEIQMIDRVGAGDAFAAGLIYCFLTGVEPARAVDFAVAASCLKHTIPGDFNLIRSEEAWKLAEDHAAGRIGR